MEFTPPTGCGRWQQGNDMGMQRITISNRWRNLSTVVVLAHGGWWQRIWRRIREVKCEGRLLLYSVQHHRWFVPTTVCIQLQKTLQCMLGLGMWTGLIPRKRRTLLPQNIIWCMRITSAATTTTPTQPTPRESSLLPSIAKEEGAAAEIDSRDRTSAVQQSFDKQMIVRHTIQQWWYWWWCRRKFENEEQIRETGFRAELNSTVRRRWQHWLMLGCCINWLWHESSSSRKQCRVATLWLTLPTHRTAQKKNREWGWVVTVTRSLVQFSSWCYLQTN